jgi:hypothetical protein
MAVSAIPFEPIPSLVVNAFLYKSLATTTPATAGTYVPSGTYNGKVAYNWSFGNMWLYFNTTGNRWFISPTKTTGSVSAGFQKTTELTLPTGSYTAFGGSNSGTPLIVKA